ncbi:hypothetical protein NLI96_g7005 [Meripilus lineatus]|uniref:Uncharacterized protein n=1 Tax=Meripilus lineatus TaxID=2056292 RepID=A0AAD5YCF5_9APHY|nr:hypothetical protein NLI96_g7005 [Physisporinus lineatus]
MTTSTAVLKHIIFNPGAFIDVIKCACTDTFQSAFPHFERTNQTDWLSTPNLPGVVNGIRQVCAIASTLLGNVSVANGEGSSTTTVPTPTASSSSAIAHLIMAAPVQVVASVAFLAIGITFVGI